MVLGKTIVFTKDCCSGGIFIKKDTIGKLRSIYRGDNYLVDIEGLKNKKREDGYFSVNSKYIKEYLFKINDIVQIISSTKYKNMYAKVIKQRLAEDIYNRHWVKVEICSEPGKIVNYYDTNLKLIKNKFYESEEFNKMANKLEGFKKVAVIDISGSDYYYALYDYDSIIVGDNVLVSGVASNRVLKVKDIIDVEVGKEKCGKNIIEEVMCKVDLSSYNKRIENRKKAAELRKKMDKKIAEMDELNKYTMYAERNPELMKMLNEYRELV